MLEDAREDAVDSAGYDVEQASDKIRAEQQNRAAAEAEYEQRRADRERKGRLYEKGVASELEYQEAERDYLSAKAKVGEAEAKVEQARNDYNAKVKKVSQIGNEYKADIESARSLREDARSKVQEAQKELAEATTAVKRQEARTVVAKRDGYILRVHAANSADLLSQGDPLIELIPDTDKLALLVELFKDE